MISISIFSFIFVFLQPLDLGEGVFLFAYIQGAFVWLARGSGVFFAFFTSIFYLFGSEICCGSVGGEGGSGEYYVETASRWLKARNEV